MSLALAFALLGVVTDLSAQARATATGTLRLRLDPENTRVFVNGSPAGGPSVRLPLGAYHLRFEAVGRLAGTLDVRIESVGQVVPIRVRLPPLRTSADRVLAVTEMQAPARVHDAGFLSVQSEPAGAIVRLDGNSIGVTPMVRLRIQDSEYYLRVSLPGFRDSEQMIRVLSGQVAALHILLRRQSP